MRKVWIGLAVFVAAIVAADIISEHYQDGGNDRVAKVVLHKSLWQRCFGAHYDTETVRHQLIGTWEMAAVRSLRGTKYYDIPPNSGHLKKWTATNWSLVGNNSDNEVIYSASGAYRLTGNLYEESIDEATGSMTNFLGHRPRFRIRIVGNNYYQLGTGNAVHEIWRRRSSH